MGVQIAEGSGNLGGCPAALKSIGTLCCGVCKKPPNQSKCCFDGLTHLGPGKPVLDGARSIHCHKV